MKDEISDAPSISIIVPAFNEAGMITRTFPAIKALSYPADKIEFILVDNGSTDKTIPIAESFGFSVILAPKETVGAMRNIGALNARGDLLAFIDADCIPDARWLKVAVKCLQGGDVGAFGTVSAQPSAMAGWVERGWSFLSSEASIVGIKKVLWLSTFNLVVSKQLFESVGGFTPNLMTCEDSDLGYRLSAKIPLLLDSTISTIHLGESKTTSEFIRREFWRGKGNLRSFFRHNPTLNEVPSVFLPLFYLMICLFFTGFLIMFPFVNKQATLILGVGVLFVPWLMLVRKKVPLKYFFIPKGPYFLSMLYLLSRGAALLLFFHKGSSCRKRH